MNFKHRYFLITSAQPLSNSSMHVEGYIYYLWQGRFTKGMQAGNIPPSLLPLPLHGTDVLLYVAGELPNSYPAHLTSPSPSMVLLTAQRVTTGSSHAFNLGSRPLPKQTSASGIINQHTKSPCLGKEAS